MNQLFILYISSFIFMDWDSGGPCFYALPFNSFVCLVIPMHSFFQSYKGYENCILVAIITSILFSKFYIFT